MLGALGEVQCHEQSSQSCKSMSYLRAHNARAVTGVKNRMPKVKARWKISASNPAVRMSSASVTLKIGHTQDLQRHDVRLLQAHQIIWKDLYMHVQCLQALQTLHMLPSFGDSHIGNLP